MFKPLTNLLAGPPAGRHRAGRVPVQPPVPEPVDGPGKHRPDRVAADRKAS